jgi:hypothetical protein
MQSENAKPEAKKGRHKEEANERREEMKGYA